MLLRCCCGAAAGGEDAPGHPLETPILNPQRGCWLLPLGQRVRAAALAPVLGFVVLLKCIIRVKKYIFWSKNPQRRMCPLRVLSFSITGCRREVPGGQAGPSGMGMGKPHWLRGTWSGIAWDFLCLNLDVPYVRSVRSYDGRKPPPPPSDRSLWSSWNENSVIRTLREMLWTVPKIPGLIPDTRISSFL